MALAVASKLTSALFSAARSVCLGYLLALISTSLSCSVSLHVYSLYISAFLFTSCLVVGWDGRVKMKRSRCRNRSQKWSQPQPFLLGNEMCSQTTSYHAHHCLLLVIIYTHTIFNSFKSTIELFCFYSGLVFQILVDMGSLSVSLRVTLWLESQMTLAESRCWMWHEASLSGCGRVSSEALLM